MSASMLGICNSALVKVGADLISDITQNTRSANVLSSIYEPMRDQVLRDHPWHFAIKRAILTPSASVPLFDYQFSFDLPSDFLRIVEIHPDWQRFMREGNQILTNDTSVSATSGLNIRYVFQNIDESSWPSDFAEAFAWKLASQLAYPLTQSLALSQGCEAAYMKALAEARYVSGTEGTVKALEADVWANSRIAYGSYGAWQDSDGSF